MDSKNSYTLSIVVAIFTMLLLGWLVYSPAISGAFLLDDMPNLRGLNHIDNKISALQFMFSGTAGPIGRPIALATFAAQASSMESGASAFLRFNILLHLFNAMLIALFFNQLSRARSNDTYQVFLVTLSATAIWLFMPLLASSSLMVIQRMTTLSATFMLIALSFYLFFRRDIDLKPRRALIGMTVALVSGTILALLTKENGALLPTLVLVLEITLLKRPTQMAGRTWLLWRAIFLAIPTAAILGYLATRVPYSEDLILRRDFNAWERLLTQSRILWEYLFNAFVPRTSAFGPFHDGYPVSRSMANPLTVLAFIGWVTVLITAAKCRRLYPLFSFAVLWYFAAHILESTVLPLELYFEHRNYVPIIGPVYALTVLAFRLPVKRMRVTYVGLPLYLIANIAVLFSVTSLWGSPALAAHYWQQAFPNSIRAITTAASHQLTEDWAEKTLSKLNHVSDERPNAAYLRIQALELTCVLAPDENHEPTILALKRELPSIDFTYTVGPMLSNLITTAKRVDCHTVDSQAIESIISAVIENPKYRYTKLYNQMHHQLLARLARLDGDLESAVSHLQNAIDERPTPELNMMMVTTLADAGEWPKARSFIKKARDNAPKNPLKRYVWLSRLDGLQAYIDALEMQEKGLDNPRT